MFRTAKLGKLVAHVLRGAVIPLYARSYLRFEQSLFEARTLQHRQLLQWIHRCRETRFGINHRFREIRSLEDYRRQVPISTYGAFEPYINAVANREFHALFPHDEPIRRFTITTGSTGTPKLKPVSRTWLKQYRKAWNLWGIKMLADHPRNVGGRILQIVGSWDMGRTPGDIPISMVSALLARHQHPFVRPFYSIPHIVSDIPDAEARHYATMRLSMAEDVGLIALMNPGSLIRLAKIGDRYSESIIRDIHDGTLSTSFDIPPLIRKKLEGRVRHRNPDGARRLHLIAERAGQLLPRDYWAQPIIACWIGGTAGYQSRDLHQFFGDSPMRDHGLVSSEGRHTIPFEDGKPEGVLAITTGFYEFVPVGEANSATPHVLEGHELEMDQDYRIILTTYSGYFRFDVGDIVRCRGFVGEAPILEFLQKSGRVGDLEGEKVTERQFLDAATAAAGELGIPLGYITAVPTRPDGELPYYCILIEAENACEPAQCQKLLAEIDRRIMALNFLYRARRREGVIGAPRLCRIPASEWAAAMEQEISQRRTGEAHYKHPALVQDPAWINRFRSCASALAPSPATGSGGCCVGASWNQTD